MSAIPAMFTMADVANKDAARKTLADWLKSIINIPELPVTMSMYADDGTSPPRLMAITRLDDEEFLNTVNQALTFTGGHAVDSSFLDGSDDYLLVRMTPQEHSMLLALRDVVESKCESNVWEIRTFIAKIVLLIRLYTYSKIHLLAADDASPVDLCTELVKVLLWAHPYDGNSVLPDEIPLLEILRAREDEEDPETVTCWCTVWERNMLSYMYDIRSAETPDYLIGHKRQLYNMIFWTVETSGFHPIYRFPLKLTSSVDKIYYLVSEYYRFTPIPGILIVYDYED